MFKKKWRLSYCVFCLCLVMDWQRSPGCNPVNLHCMDNQNQLHAQKPRIAKVLQ